MKHWILAAAIFTMGAGAAIYVQVRHVPSRVSPAPVLYFIADSERELTRLPVNFTRLSDAEETKIGKQLAAAYSPRWLTSAGESAEEREVRFYVERVGAQVATHAYRKLPWTFHYIPSMDYFNAFALPGGHVYIGGGLISLMDSEDELAAVLGHEVEHVDHYHCVERYQTELALRHFPLGALVAIPVVVFETGYSKSEELEADREGTRLAVLAGYSPLGAISMFEEFARLERDRTGRAQTPQQELSRVAEQTLEGYFRSHPLPSERIEQIRRMVSQENWANVPAERNLQFEYIFFTRRAKRAVQANQFQQAAQLAARSLELNPEQPEALAALAEARFALRDYDASATAYRRLLALSPREAAGVVDFAASRAQAALQKTKYDEAADLAEETLRLQPDAAPALGVLGDAKFALADFQTAAAAYHKAVDANPGNAARAADFATALSAKGEPRQAATEFDAWLKTLRSPGIAVSGQVQIDQAGLDMLAGDSTAFNRMLSQARSATVSMLNAEALTRLAWWCYRAGKYPLATDLLQIATQDRGATPEAFNTLGWVLVQQGEYLRAAGNFRDPMGRAIARWQIQKREYVVRDFNEASKAKPEWLNPKWVRALYSERVEAIITELTAELNRLPLTARN
ncbi:MAG TPA: M48 family metalloprotease [Terriglobia bacterium]|nr:M48 family metalloprotease [Terriglobia bacterium]